jgi:hypothetical protein
MLKQVRIAPIAISPKPFVDLTTLLLSLELKAGVASSFRMRPETNGYAIIDTIANKKISNGIPPTQVTSTKKLWGSAGVSDAVMAFTCA